MKVVNLCEKIIRFTENLEFSGKLPAGIDVMNPYRENKNVPEIASKFYRKFYNDSRKRTLILGINPGRLGAGATGIPFTDTKRLSQYCGLEIPEISTHEPSSVFVYKMIEAYGGPEKFYGKFFISSVSPLGFVAKKNGNLINYNYYDDKKLEKAVEPFAIQTIRQTIELGMNTDKVFCLGTGKNYKFLKELNAKHKLFADVIPLEHPRYIMQYKSKDIQLYIDKYLIQLT